MMVLPEDDGPNSLVKSTVIVRILPFTESSTFFKDNLRARECGLDDNWPHYTVDRPEKRQGDTLTQLVWHGHNIPQSIPFEISV